MMVGRGGNVMDGLRLKALIVDFFKTEGAERGNIKVKF